jgi:hypothetical protein
MTEAIVKVEEVRAEIKDLVKWFKDNSSLGQKKWMRLAHLLRDVRDNQMWKEWKAGSGKKFSTFDDYVEGEVGISKSKAYYMLDVVDHLKGKMSAKDMEQIGKTACYELARVGKDKPKAFDRVLAKVKKNPDMPIGQIKNIVSAALEGRALDTNDYERVEFLVKEADYLTVVKALTVMQTDDPVERPDGPFGRGVHLVSMSQEILSDEHYKAILRKLEKAGAFNNKHTPFQLED